MTSYVNKKTRVFRDAGDAPPVARKRSEGRMKTYPSATDARAWCIINEDRRQHILEIVKQGGGQGLKLGRYVPIDVLIDTLLANKDADIERLKKQIGELQKELEAYQKLDLTDEQKDQLAGVRKSLLKAEDELSKQKPDDIITDTLSDKPKSISEDKKQIKSPSGSIKTSGSSKGSTKPDDNMKGESSSLKSGGKAGSIKSGSSKPGDTSKLESVKSESLKDGPPKDPSIKEASIKDASIKDASVKDASVKDASVKEGSIKDASVKGGSIKDASVKDGSIKDASVKDVIVIDESIKDASVKDATLKDGSIKEGSVKGTTGEIANDEIEIITIDNESVTSSGKKDDKSRGSKSIAEDKKPAQEEIISKKSDTSSVHSKKSAQPIAPEPEITKTSVTTQESIKTPFKPPEPSKEKSDECCDPTCEAMRSAKVCSAVKKVAIKEAAEKACSAQRKGKRVNEPEAISSKSKDSNTPPKPKKVPSPIAAKESIESPPGAPPQNVSPKQSPQQLPVEPETPESKPTDVIDTTQVIPTVPEKESVLSSPKEDVAPVKQPPTDSGGVEDLTNKYIYLESSGDLNEIIKQKDVEISALKKELTILRDECEEQKRLATEAVEKLDQLKDIATERDTLKKKLSETDDSGSGKMTKTTRSDDCQGEIEAMENEIEMIKKGGMTPEQEAEVIRKELEVLKKYCTKLSSIQDENVRLKEQLKAALVRTGAGPEGDDLSDALEKLTQITEERNKLKDRVMQLENQLLAYGDLPDEIEVIRERSRVLDDVMQERNELLARMENMKNMEDQIGILQKKAERVNKLERQLDALQQELCRQKRSSQVEINSIRSQQCSASKEISCLKQERDMAQKELQRMKNECEQIRCEAIAACNANDEEIQKLRYRAKEAEVLRIERDRMKVRLDELSAIEVEFMELVDKTRCLDCIIAERDMYKNKYEEILDLECECDMLRGQVKKAKLIDQERDALKRRLRECEQCIADQESEINRLMNHVERLTQGRDEQQERIKQALGDMRGELEKKNMLIRTSEEQLAAVQNQLKASIAGVSAETQAIKEQNEMLEKQIKECTGYVKEKQDEINFLHDHIREKDLLIHKLTEDKRASIRSIDDNEIKDNIIKELKAKIKSMELENEHLKALANNMGKIASDPHLQELLKTSKESILKLLDATKTSEEKRHSSIKPVIEPVIPSIEKKLTETIPLSTSIQEDKRPSTASNRLSQTVKPADTASVRSQTNTSSINQERTSISSQTRPAAASIASQSKGKPEITTASQAIKPTVKESATDPANWTCKKDRILATDPANWDCKKVVLTEEEVNKLQDKVSSAAILEAEVNALKKHSSEIQNAAKDQLTELTDRLQKAMERIAELEKENANLRQQLASQSKQAPASGEAVKDSDYDKLREELEKSQREQSKLNTLLKDLQNTRGSSDPISQLASLKASYSDLEAQLEKEIKLRKEAEQTIKDLEAKIASLSSGGDTEELNRLRTENDALKQEIKKLQENTATLNDELQALKSSSSDAASADKLLKTNELLKDENNDLRKQLDSYKSSDGADLAKCLQENTSLKSEIENLKKELSERSKKGDNATVHQQMNEVLDQNVKMNNELKELQTTNKQQASKLQQLESENKDLKAQNESLLKQLNDAKTTGSKDDKASNKEIDSLKAKLDAQEKELKNLKTENASLKTNNTNLKSDVDRLNTENSKLKSADSSKAKDSNKSLEDLQKQIENLKKENDQVKKERDDIKKERDDIKKERDDIKKERDEIKSQSDKSKESTQNTDDKAIADLKAELENLKKQNLALKSENQVNVDALNKVLRDAPKQEADAQDEKQKEDLSKLVGDLEGQLVNLKKQLEGCESRNVESLKKLHDAEDKISGLTKSLSHATEQIKELSGQNEKLGTIQRTSVVENDKLTAEFKKKLDALEKENAELKKKLNEGGDNDELNKVKAKLAEKETELANLQKAMGSEDKDEAIKELYEKKIKDLENELEKQKKDCMEQIASLKSQYDRDVKNLHNKHNDGVKQLQGSHEEMMHDLSKELDAEVEMLRKELFKCQEKIAQLEKEKAALEKTLEDCKGTNVSDTNADDKINLDEPKEGKKVAVDPEFAKILNKILNEGIEALTFDELQYLHTKTIDATTNILDKEKRCKVRDDDARGRGNVDIVRKQQDALTQVQKLQMEIALEKQRLEDLKKHLNAERDRNADLLKKLKSQNKTVSELQAENMKQQHSYHEDKLARFMHNVEKEKDKVRHLEDELERERFMVRQLREMLEVENKVPSHGMYPRPEPIKTAMRSPPMPMPPFARPMGFRGGPLAPRGPPPLNPQSFYTELTTRDRRPRPKCECD